jgi:diguanylate cyclase (GGDEF)-like protein
MFIFTLIVFISGRDQSSYKALFLFAIMNVTLKKGMKAGIFIAVVSAISILLTDFLLSDLTFINNRLIIPYFGSDIILSGIFIIAAWMLGYCVNLNIEYIRRLEDSAHKDSLTGFYNHGYFYTKLTEYEKISKLNSYKLSLIFLDIDDFKYYNDLNGHQNGDYALKNLANILKSSVRINDTVARYGGEEFAIIMQNVGEEQAIIWAEKIRLAIENAEFYGEENQPKGKLTVSIGISEYPTKAKNSTELIKSADDALYRAKFLYKNRVETYISILDDIKNKVNDKDKEVITSIKTLISVINAKDRYTYGHVERVVMYAKLIADKLNLNDKDKETLIYGAYIHDIGKINISKEILIKKMPLTDNEWLELKNHPLFGFDIIKDIHSLKHVAYLVLHHHERYDGLGYPNGLQGKDIPYLTRILTVIDSFDAMTSNRPYNTCKSYEEGKEELIKCSGSQFDPEIAQAFVNVIDTTLIKNNINIT